jgi:cysteine desulfurase
MSPIRPPVYLDYSATTPLDPRVFEKMRPWHTTAFGNPGSRDHRFGWDAAAAVEEARYHVAALINAVPSEIVFTSCATESINLAVKGWAFRRGGIRRAIVTTPVEHEAVLESCRWLEAGGHVQATYLAVDAAGRLELREVERAVHASRAGLVSVMSANNEIGTCYDVAGLAAVAHAAGALFFSDATQAAGKIPLDVRAVEFDLLAFSAHKLCGPQGVGALFVRRGTAEASLTPLLSGGGQERGWRSGTLNVAGIVGFGEACRIAAAEMASEAQQLCRLRDQLESGILSALPGVTVNGGQVERLPHITNLCFHGIGARTLIRQMHDIAVATRSACATAHTGPSHVLKAIGLSDDDAYSSLRFSLGRFTTAEEIAYAVDKVVTTTIRLRQPRTVPAPDTP